MFAHYYVLDFPEDMLLNISRHTKFGVSRQCVQNVSKKQKQKIGVVNRPDQGSDRATTKREDRRLFTLCKEGRYKTSRKLASEWVLPNVPVVTPRTVRNRLVEAGYRSYVTKRKPFRKARYRHVRLKFAREHQYWSDNDWKCVVFFDESHFEVLNRKNRSFVRRLRSEQDKPFNFRACVQGGGSCVSVWRCMTAEGIGTLVVDKGQVNGKKYIDMLILSLPSFIKKRFKPDQKWYFMQDNARCHRCKFSKQ
ncbi:unnamed protein product [Didymodactylos carnosus]|uniref:Transposase Tc1-like domain-containing protein n=1 Tax=Didymodactylos carnosus TaxID=1234261 RepID=A0A814ZSM5_9BILA|nr:unnamed protein product [Didymodactylos carnosus]CAF1283745.1 unnamed protein product [Didymodactylos carnosus]CAF4011454.1 unnamed protein product [Didymodactylos carnosus]CAF4088732.1 unnamed protein product [Didymodactylos carnosus]